MAKPKSLDGWGRDKARKRYEEGGEVIADPAATRTAEIDEFISKVMRDQIAKMNQDGVE